MEDLIIVSLGGSLIVPEEIDTDFLKKFRELVLKYVDKGKKFILITGGGKVCRKYQSAAAGVRHLEKEDLDWLGIHSTRLNAHLVRTIFRDVAHNRVVKDPNEKVDFKESVLVAAGWKPGCSTDYDAVLLAKTYGVKKVANLTNIEYVYDKDPKKFDDAKKIEHISWDDFRKIVGDKWDPGLNLPFDPMASKGAHELGLEVAIMGGSDLDNFESYINGNEFKGTTIS
ncbi:MAG: UMP kinase [Nanoarchaeota archaeon]|nr:UMP kinase [Nanoarchaeota archaeon]MCG2717459.1 UMP kinase [Nanoarchaeota archaeon]